MNHRVVAPDPVFAQSYSTILKKQEFIIHNSVTQPVQYSLYTMPTMSTIYDKPGLDGIELILTVTSQVISKQMKRLIEKNLQHHNSLKRMTLT
jgi:hypothetical protein